VTDEELTTHLLGDAVLSFDSSAIHFNELIRYANKVNLFNDQRKVKTRLVLSALVHTERMAQERRRRQEAFDQGRIAQFLHGKGITVEPLTAEDAVGCSSWLHAQASTEDGWTELKWSRIREEAGLRDDAPGRVSATVDWFIAAHAAARGWILVTSDRGPEFRGITRKVAPERLERTLDTLLAATTARAG
jgi:hypothetical protein